MTARLAIRVLLPVLLIGFGGCPAPPEYGFRNGSFEEQVYVGWEPDPSGSTLAVYSRSDTFGQPLSGHAVKVTRYEQGYARLSQVLELAGTDYRLSFDARFTNGGSTVCNPVARIRVYYLDVMDEDLGRTEWYLPALDTVSGSTGTCHYLPVTAAGLWSSYSLNIGEELSAGLGGIDPADIVRLRVAIDATVASSG